MTLQEALRHAREKHICFCASGCPDGPNGGEEFYRGMGFCGCWCHIKLYQRLLGMEPDAPPTHP